MECYHNYYKNEDGTVECYKCHLLKSTIESIAQQDLGEFTSQKLPDESKALEWDRIKEQENYPLSVSEWSRIGKERGYWSYFRDLMRSDWQNETIKKLEMMRKGQHTGLLNYKQKEDNKENEVFDGVLDKIIKAIEPEK